MERAFDKWAFQISFPKANRSELNPAKKGRTWPCSLTLRLIWRLIIRNVAIFYFGSLHNSVGASASPCGRVWQKGHLTLADEDGRRCCSKTGIIAVGVIKDPKNGRFLRSGRAEQQTFLVTIMLSSRHDLLAIRLQNRIRMVWAEWKKPFFCG